MKASTIGIDPIRAWRAVAILGLLLSLMAVPGSGPAEAAVPGLNFTQTGCEGYSDSVARLYTAGFDRVPEPGGFQFWISEYTSGRWSLPRMATFFTQSPEFMTRYGALSQDGFIRQIYRNVLGREGEAGGVAFWNGQMSAGTDRGTLLLRFAESPENIGRSGTSQPTLGPFNGGLVGPWTCAPNPPPVGPTPGSIVFATPLSPVSVTAGGDATFSWAASAPSSGTVRYKIETNAEDGVGDGNGWWDFGTQTGTSYTFRNVQLSDNATIVRVTASNGVDREAASLALLTVRPANPAPLEILFARLLSDSHDVYIMNADGTGQENLTNSPSEDYPQGFSPDGTKILFFSSRTGNGEVFTMNVDGTGVRNLSNNPASDSPVTFSPNGSKILFWRNASDLYIMNADGTGQKYLTSDAGSVVAFSPDGSKVIYMDTVYTDVYVVNADGTGVRNLSNNPVGADSPVAFSPDGSKIVFWSTRDAGNAEIYIMNADGTGQTRLTNSPASDVPRAFSPDGSKILFARTLDGQLSEVYVMNADGTGQANLSNNPLGDYPVAFSPDGSKILFNSNRDMKTSVDVYIMNADGTGQSRLTNAEGDDGAVAFSP